LQHQLAARVEQVEPPLIKMHEVGYL
jgi:hypothetical protein